MSVNRRTGSLARKVMCENKRWYPSVTLNPIAISNTANTASWNQSIPKYHRYNGTAVSVRTKVPIRNALVVQLMRSVGMRKIKGGNFADGSLDHDVGRARITSCFVQVWTLPQCAQVNFCVFT